MAKRTYPCDIDNTCPFEAELNSSGYACRNYCGMGVDESAIDVTDSEDEFVGEITAEDLAEYQGRKYNG